MVGQDQTRLTKTKQALVVDGFSLVCMYRYIYIYIYIYIVKLPQFSQGVSQGSNPDSAAGS